jgi:hypothetical protein
MSTAVKLVKPVHSEADPLRHDLARAIQERGLARRKRDAAADAVERSHAFVHELDERLQAVAEKDAQVIRERAEHFRAALVEATPPTLSTSAKLSTAALARLEAENTAEAARQAHAAIAAELEEAEDRLVLLSANVLQAAKAVVSNLADVMALELKEAEHAVAIKRRKLMGIGQMRGPHIGPYKIGAQTMSVLRNDSREVYSHCEPEDVQFFDRYLARLQQDANAQPEEVE